MKFRYLLVWVAIAWAPLIVILSCPGCAVGWQINMPLANSQSHSRGTGYTAASGKQLGGGEGQTEAFQQLRAGGDMPLSVEADKATDLAAAKGQSQVATETAKGARQGQGTASGDITPTSSPKVSTSKAATTAVAQTGAIAKGVAPADSDGTVQGGGDGAPPAAAPAPTIAELQAEVANRQRVADLVGSGGGADGADSPAQATAKAELAAARQRLADAQEASAAVPPSR